MAVERRTVLSGQGRLNGELSDAKVIIEAWIRVSMMELSVTPTEERIIVASADASIKRLVARDRLMISAA